jgi:acyl-coenzyme A thioesterase PaaI-like protein
LTSDTAPVARVGPRSAARPSQRIDERFAFEPHNCFACGMLNANGLHLDLHVDGERCWTELAIPARFQGWDEIAHGGIVTTILDEVMAWSLVDRDNWGLTARLTVSFKRPVPLGVPILAEGWITQARRRLIETAGRITNPASGELLATAEATYVAAGDERKRELKERYGYRAVEPGRSDGGGSAR